MQKSHSLRDLTLAAILAAVYAVLTITLPIPQYGAVQLRLAEALTVLPFFFPAATPGLFVGCILANLVSPYPLDIVCGSAATLLAALWTQRMPNRWLAPLPPVLCNAVIVGAEIAWFEGGFTPAFWPAYAFNALTVGLGVSAMAASRTITVDDNIRITLNGAVFSPKDAKGRDVPLFSYNGTTYAPVRAICEAAGLKVDFDSANYTAVLTTPDRYIASTPSASNYISVDKAKEIALNHAGVKAADAIFVKAGLDWDDGRTEYEVEFYAGNTEYDYSIDATTGAIRSYDHDWDDFSLWNPGNNAANPSTPGTSTNNLISEAKAKEIALAKAPSGASVVRCHLDWDDGRYIYEIKMVSGTMEYECDINAATGVITDWDVDSIYD